MGENIYFFEISLKFFSVSDFLRSLRSSIILDLFKLSEFITGILYILCIPSGKKIGLKNFIYFIITQKSVLEVKKKFVTGTYFLSKKGPFFHFAVPKGPDLEAFLTKKDQHHGPFGTVNGQRVPIWPPFQNFFFATFFRHFF